MIIIPNLRYSGPFLKWTREELRQIDQITKKMHKALQPRDETDIYIYQEKTEEKASPALRSV